MAQKKNELQVTSGKKNAVDVKKNSNGKNVKYKKVEEEPEKKFKIKANPRALCAAISGILFLIFLLAWISPNAPLIRPISVVFLALIGQAACYWAIPVTLFLFSILMFSYKRPVLMRSICLCVFLLILGCFSHLIMPKAPLGSGFQWVKDIVVGGVNGTTGGLVCGGLVELMLWGFQEEVITVIILATAGVLTFLASFQITIPSIIRAIQNRPRAEWEEIEEEVQEPAAVVVNHLVNKHIERVERKRQQQQEAQEVLEARDPFEVAESSVTPRHKEEPKPDRKNKSANPYVTEQVDDSIFTPIVVPKKDVSENLPKNMPEMDMADLQNVEQPAVAVDMKPKVTAKEAAESAAQVAQEIAENEAAAKPVYCFPPIDLLKGNSGGAADGTAEMRENSRRLNETLASFKIEAHITNVTRGPSVTRYEVELDKGVRLNKLTTIADDIALSLGSSGVRIAAVPDRISVVGIEVPNRAVTMVSLREVIDSQEFHKAKSKSSFAVGKDISGNCIVGNIAKLPHMLIAGTTGSGKSVCMNSIIISLLYKASPEEVKLIMIDPKMVELGIYNAIPHLLIPVVTDPKKAAGSLQWAVTEMMRRYKAMSEAGVRDLSAYNEIVESTGEGVKLPQVVVIIDELADLMLVAAKEVEESICRIAQMGRASGIHLVIATQRPSADVITGLMKANIPSRIAFSVASAMESRIILDTVGAEKLVGKGDMLFSPIGSGKPLRVQGCFVSDSEVEAVATYVKDNFNTDYDNDIMEDIEKRASQTGNSSAKATASDPEPNDSELGGDEMLPAAVDVILETNQASVSMLQRRLKLGYARAARIVDEMEEKGFVGPFQGSKPRAILITKEQWDAMKGGQPTQMEIDELPFDEGEDGKLD